MHHSLARHPGHVVRRVLVVAGWLAGTAFFAAATVTAQEPDTARSATVADTMPLYELAPLEATVTRGGLEAEATPFAVTEVAGPGIRRGRPALGLDEALAMVPGLQADDRHNLALGTRIAARGLGARAAFGVRGVRILVDGIPLTLPDGQTALTNLDLAAAGRIQVIRGPASVLYGNAAGGVISVDTREPPRAGIAEGRVLAGDYGTDELGALARFEATVGKGGETSYLVTASHLDLDGYRRHSAARRTGLNARLRHAPDEDSYVTVVVNAAAVPQAQSPGSVPADTLLVAPTRAWPTNVETKSGEQVEQLQAGISYVRRLGVHRLDLTAYGAGRALDNALPFAFIELGRWAGGLRAAVRSHLEPLGRPLHLTAGLDLEHQRDDRRESDNVGGEPGQELRQDRLDRVTGIGPFLQGQLGVVRGLEIRAGLRYDAVRFTSTDRLGTGRDRAASRLLDATSVSTGLFVRPAGGVTAFANFATAFQTPTTTELINAPPADGGPCCPAGFNPDLEPQRARSIEAGLRFDAAPVAGEIVGYTMVIRDALVPFQVAGAEGREFFRNAGRTRNRGFEASIAVRPARHLTLRLAHTSTLVTILDDGAADRDDEGHRLPGVPPHRLGLAAEYDDGRSFVAVQLQATDRYYVDEANTAANPPEPGSPLPGFDGYATLDARVGTTVTALGADLAPFVAVENALDSHHASSVVVNAFGGRYYEPAPGRMISFGVRVATPGNR